MDDSRSKIYEKLFDTRRTNMMNSDPSGKPSTTIHNLQISAPAGISLVFGLLSPSLEFKHT
jgi:hypothetical protein